MPTMTTPQEIAAAIDAALESGGYLVIRFAHGQMRQLKLEEVELLVATLKGSAPPEEPLTFANVDFTNRAQVDKLLDRASEAARQAWAEAARKHEHDFWWRDASRERPHPNRLVIAWSEPYGAVLADRTTRNPDFGWSCEGKVTHWMPLPQTPPQNESAK